MVSKIILLKTFMGEKWVGQGLPGLSAGYATSILSRILEHNYFKFVYFY